jgi:hypothetical protein
MNSTDIFNHLLNFVAPALALALLLPLAARLIVSKTVKPLSWWLQVAINFAACSVALMASLWWWGSDGKMAAYAALLLVGASSQWLVSRGWRN